MSLRFPTARSIARRPPVPRHRRRQRHRPRDGARRRAPRRPARDHRHQRGAARRRSAPSSAARWPHKRAFDITDIDAVRAFADDVHAEHGSVDVVMNVAGIATWGPVERLTHEQWRRTVDINLMGPIHVIECFVPEMIRAGRGGQIVERLVGGRPARPPVARALQRREVRPARRLRGAALRPAAAQHRRLARLPRRRRHADRAVGRHRGRRPPGRAATAASDGASGGTPRAPSRPPSASSTASSATATSSTPRATSARCTWSQRVFPPAYVAMMRGGEPLHGQRARAARRKRSGCTAQRVERHRQHLVVADEHRQLDQLGLARARASRSACQLSSAERARGVQLVDRAEDRALARAPAVGLRAVAHALRRRRS